MILSKLGAVLLALWLSTFSIKGFADPNSKVFDCVARANDTVAEIVIDSVSNSKMKITTKAGAYICALKITLADDLTRGIDPYLYYEFEKGDCGPVLDKNLEADFVKQIQLKLFVLDKKITRSTLRWLKSAQPADCQIKVSRLFDARLNIKKWGDQHLPDRNVSSGK